MTAEYERFHGIVLRELIVRSPKPLLVEARAESGRVHSFCLNGQVGVHIKHSAKRLPPWQFTFNHDSLLEINNLIEDYSSFWLMLVCGLDGVVTLSVNEFRVLTAVKSDVTRFIRVDRDRNTMYRIFGNAGKLKKAKPRGVAEVISNTPLLANRP